MTDWYVYILLCKNDKLYTGVARDPKQRLLAHQKKLGAKYTRSHPPQKIVYLETFPDRSSAQKREAVIKRLTKKQKETLISKYHQ